MTMERADGATQVVQMDTGHPGVIGHDHRVTWLVLCERCNRPIGMLTLTAIVEQVDGEPDGVTFTRLPKLPVGRHDRCR